MDGMTKTNLVIAKVLNLAMERGVTHWSLRFSDLGLDQEFEAFFFPCIEWLEKEGLIRVGNYARSLAGLASGQVNNIALTARGMAVMGQIIEVEGSRQPLSEAVKTVSGGKVDYHRIGDAIGGILGGFLKSMAG